MNVSSIKGSYGTEKVKSSKKDWKLTDTLREQVIEYAKEDAKKNVYMGEKFKCLRKSEVAKVAPDRMALIATINQATSFGDMGDMQKIKGSGERWLYVLFGIPYEAEFQSVGFGSAIHVYDENGDEILTYTGGVGWQEKESKAETMVHKSLRLTYYNAWQDAKKEIKKKSNKIADSSFLRTEKYCGKVVLILKHDYDNRKSTHMRAKTEKRNREWE